MEIRAVADVGKNMLGVGKRRLADPVHPFAAHVGKRLGLAVHPDRHVVAADARCGT